MPSRAAVLEGKVSMGLHIPPEFERAVRDRVASGMYDSVDDVLQACLDALVHEEEFQAEEMDWLRKQIDVGIADAERGDVLPGDEAFEQIRAELRRRGAL
ncbi:MAG TPA: hypothetical protein VJT67_15855 [Longimicrobiaceae bacterium]|nr:hypothetical protein [Longimicrobiaceae bacterium]